MKRLDISEIRWILRKRVREVLSLETGAAIVGAGRVWRPWRQTVSGCGIRFPRASLSAGVAGSVIPSRWMLLLLRPGLQRATRRPQSVPRLHLDTAIEQSRYAYASCFSPPFATRIAASRQPGRSGRQR
jgi:hypothetical protein